MHRLARQIRFQIDPFGRHEFPGANSYAGKPVTEGIGLYLALWVHLKSKIDADTGFVVNVSEIDAAVREWVIPYYQQRFNAWFRNRQTPGWNELVELLRESRQRLLAALGGPKRLWKMEMEISPFRKISVAWETVEMVTYTEKFEFAAMHKLWNEKFDKKTNYKLFGKCANPTGHGHNYILEVVVEPPKTKMGWLEPFEKIVKERFIDIVDHKNLNKDVSIFQKTNPTVENIAKFAWKSLKSKLKPCKLVEVIVWENDRTYCRYSES
jgi:6-pyruvoyltetrahydropterin/6-carboxytetrahydropterin synthase